MTLSSLAIIAIVLAAVSAALLFVPRVPSVVLSYISLICAGLSGAQYITTQVYIYWAVATAIVLGLRVLQPQSAKYGRGYICGGALTGALLGYLLSPTAASMILCSALGAFFGGAAYMRTPRSPRMAINSPRFLSYLAAQGLPAVVSSVMAAIAVMSVL